MEGNLTLMYQGQGDNFYICLQAVRGVAPSNLVSIYNENVVIPRLSGALVSTGTTANERLVRNFLGQRTNQLFFHNSDSSANVGMGDAAIRRDRILVREDGNQIAHNFFYIGPRDRNHYEGLNALCDATGLEIQENKLSFLTYSMAQRLSSELGPKVAAQMLVELTEDFGKEYEF